AFLQDPVEAGVVRQLLADACRSPSGGNLQPWRIHAVVGPATQTLKHRMMSFLDSGGQSKPEHEVYPKHLWEPFKRRRRDAGALRYRALCVPDKDAQAAAQLLRDNASFFGAPVGLFFCIDRRFGCAQWADLGLVMQNVMLLAIEQGLDTCPQAVWSNWPGEVREFLGIDGDTMIAAGMALGYGDMTAPINLFRTSRAEPAEQFTVHGA
ncbi:MAG: nitroreductase, partial [Variovorax sp.]|nr:nitroreductase [Variovorax sp.]